MNLNELSRIDALIAHHIFGIAINPQHQVIQPGLGVGTPHSYSTNIAWAWKVLEKLQGVVDLKSTPQGWWVRIAVREGNTDRFVEAEAPQAPLAICLAALRLYEHD